MSRFRIASTVVTRWDEKAGLRGDALGSQVIDALDDQTGCFRPAPPGLFTPRSKKRSSSAAGEHMLAADNGHCTAFARVV
jgi:hypothetical protein